MMIIPFGIFIKRKNYEMLKNKNKNQRYYGTNSFHIFHVDILHKKKNEMV